MKLENGSITLKIELILFFEHKFDEFKKKKFKKVPANN